jgi:hypothetical protein
MSIQIGGINLADAIVNSEFRIAVLERIVDRLLKVSPPGTLTPEAMEVIQSETIQMLQKKYPQAGLQKKV